MPTLAYAQSSTDPALWTSMQAFSTVQATEKATSQPASDRYGLFGLLDHRSKYGADFFPEPLNADEADVDNEIAGSWFHGASRNRKFDSGSVEVEKSIGLLTVEIAAGYESDRTTSIDDSGNVSRDTSEGFSNIELGARHPFFQYVSDDGFFDTTFVAGMEISPPVHSHVSRDIEFVPKVFNLTKLGDHFSVQTGFGDSILAGPEGHGLSTLEYDVVFGYELTHETLPIPLVASTTPIVEFDGERTLNQDDAGHNELFLDLGARFTFEPLDFLYGVEPKLGLGAVLPVDDGARGEFDWGVVTSVIFEF